jgi:hypothetical protein
MLKIKWTSRITNEEVFQWVTEERLLLKFLNNRRHSWIGYIIRHNEFVVNILEGAISGKKGLGKTSTTILKASRQEYKSGQLYDNGKNSLQQIQMESCQPIKRLKKKNKELTRCNRVVEFLISMFLKCSICFGRHTAHHQELKTVITACGFTYAFGCRPLWWLSHRSGRQPETSVKPQVAITVFELLMMSGVSPETC